MIYKTQTLPNGVEIISGTSEDGRVVSFSKNLANTDYQKYLEWLAEGNEPLPPDEETN
jgi:hypothetical protein